MNGLFETMRELTSGGHPFQEEYKARILEATPLRRTGKVEEIAESVAFVASDKATFITGTILCVDGGIVMH